MRRKGVRRERRKKRAKKKKIPSSATIVATVRCPSLRVGAVNRRVRRSVLVKGLALNIKKLVKFNINKLIN